MIGNDEFKAIRDRVMKEMQAVIKREAVIKAHAMLQGTITFDMIDAHGGGPSQCYRWMGVPVTYEQFKALEAASRGL